MAAVGVRHSFGLLLAVGIGMLAATVLLCTVPLYTSLIAPLAVDHVLAIAHPHDLTLRTG
jgi:hypothetical protein